MKYYWDIIIVGAGILGLATAKTLKENRPDLEVLVVDKQSTAGQGNSAKSNACYRNVFSTSANIDLCNSSIYYYKHLEASGIDLELKEFGYLWLLSHEQYLSRNTPLIDLDKDTKISFLEFLKLHDVEFEIYNEGELQKLLPHLQTRPDRSSSYIPLQDITHGLLGRQCGALSPDLLVMAYLKIFRDLGGSIMYDSEITRLLLKEQESGYTEDYLPTVWRESEIAGVEVLKENKLSLLFAKKVVLCTGAWIQQLLDPLGIDSLTRPKKRQLFRICGIEDLIHGPHFPNNLDSVPFLILPVGGIFGKPIPEANCADFGCSDDIGRRFETRTPDSMERPTAYNQYLDDPAGETDFYIYNVLPVLQAYFPTVITEKTRIDAPSAGMYAYSPDKNPIIDQNTDLGNLYIVTGASGSGIMKADSIARIAAALIEGKEIAQLFNGMNVKVSDFGLKYRNMEKEKMVL